MRTGKKPIIAALNGLAVGGSTEMVINCDMVIAAANATLALPDVKVGLTGFGGTFPRLVQRIGRNRATDMCLTGRNISADEAYRWGLINQVVEPGEDVVMAALDLAKQVAANSPDAIIATRDGLIMGEGSESGTGGALDAGKKFIKKWLWLVDSENCVEGINAFNQRRVPRWKPTKL
jgi:enoyl-CoA hydratase/carnithine racemase